MENLPPVIISGSIAIDRIMDFGGHFPDLIKADKLHSLSISILLDNLRDTRGGIGANIAYSMALLGDKPVLLGSAGKDAGQYMDSLAKLGIDTSHVHKSRLPTASFNVITDGASRQVGGFYPGAMADSSSLSLEPWKDQKPLVVISPHDPTAMARQVGQCKKYGLRLFYDVSQQVTNTSGEDIRAGATITELLVLNDYELSVLCQKTSKTEKALKSEVPLVITTLGAEGSIIEGKDVPKAVRVGVAKPKKMADPTGAGDAYRAGFLHGYIRNWDLKVCAQLGAVCAAYAIEHVGTQSHSFSPAEAAQRYHTAFNEHLPQ